MAAVGMLALLDDIASLLDDVAAMSKIATKKAAGVLGDDLALGAGQAKGDVHQEDIDVHGELEAKRKAAERELPVVWAIFKGSIINKLILIPIALALSVVYPPLITVALFLGGLYLALEGFEKVYEHFFMSKEENEEDKKASRLSEKDKVKGAIRTDMILSLEVIILTLGIVAESSFITKASTLLIIGLAMSVFVYSMIALIIRLDDIGFYLEKKKSAFAKKSGEVLISSAPVVMKALGIIGTIAMFSVGGGIIAHITHLHFFDNSFYALLSETAFGVVVGFGVFLIVESAHFIYGKIKGSH